MLHVDASVETDLSTKVCLESLRRHCGSHRLDRVEHIHTQGDQIWNEFADRTTAVIQHFPTQTMDAIDHLLEIRRHEVPEHSQGNQRPRLAAKVADQQVQVNPSARDFGGSRVVLPIKVGELCARKCTQSGRSDMSRNIPSQPRTRPGLCQTSANPYSNAY